MITQRQARQVDRAGKPFAEDNIWLRERRREQRALDLLIARLDAEPGDARGALIAAAIVGAATAARALPPKARLIALTPKSTR